MKMQERCSMRKFFKSPRINRRIELPSERKNASRTFISNKSGERFWYLTNKTVSARADCNMTEDRLSSSGEVFLRDKRRLHYNSDRSRPNYWKITFTSALPYVRICFCWSRRRRLPYRLSDNRRTWENLQYVKFLFANTRVHTYT